MSNIKEAISEQGIQEQFRSLLKERSEQFVTSLLSVVDNDEKFKDVDSRSIINAALFAAMLDLPISPSLGYAYIIPYKRKAQFQIGYKGYIQLALRTNQYEKIGCEVIYQSQLVLWDPIEETLQIDIAKAAEGSPVAGYAAWFVLKNGFKKVAYWTDKRVAEHAMRYVPSFKSEESLWKKEREKMSMKTVLKHTLSKWGILSIELQNAIRADGGVIIDPGRVDVLYEADIDDMSPSKEELETLLIDKAFSLSEKEFARARQILDNNEAKSFKKLYDYLNKIQ